VTFITHLLNCCAYRTYHHCRHLVQSTSTAAILSLSANSSSNYTSLELPLLKEPKKKWQEFVDRLSHLQIFSTKNRFNAPAFVFRTLCAGGGGCFWSSVPFHPLHMRGRCLLLRVCSEISSPPCWLFSVLSPLRVLPSLLPLLVQKYNKCQVHLGHQHNGPIYISVYIHILGELDIYRGELDHTYKPFSHTPHTPHTPSLPPSLLPHTTALGQVRPVLHCQVCGKIFQNSSEKEDVWRGIWGRI